MEISRSSATLLMSVIDISGALLSFYVALIITRSFGFGSVKELLQLAHRVVLIAVSLAFAWHAEDILVNNERHGLTWTNVVLHISLLGALILSSVRLRLAQKREANGLPYKNGGVFAGPFHSGG